MVVGILTFIGGIFLARSIRFSFMPQSETDRWAVAAAFAATVSGAVIAALGAWAAGVRVAGGAEGSVGEDDESPGDSSLSLESGASRSDRVAPGSVALRVSALTVGAIANFIVLANLIASVEGSLPEASLIAISVALAVISLYLAHVAGVLLYRRKYAVGAICACLWGLMAAGIAWSHLSVVRKGDVLVVASATEGEIYGSVNPNVPSMIVLLILYVATGVAVMFGPYVNARW